MTQSEEQTKLEKKLGLDSIKDLAVNQFPQFLQEIPSMDKESVMAIVATLPDFRHLVTGSLDQVEKGANSVLAAHWRSQKKVHAAFKDYRRMIERELDRGPLSPEERYHLLGLVKEAIELEKEMNDDHKAFALAAVKTVAIAGAAIGAVAIASAATLLSNNSSDKS